MTGQARKFEMHRDTDVSGVSGTGRVAEGIEFSDGTVVIRWLGESPSTVVWPDIGAAMSVHGHGGSTRFIYEFSGAVPPIIVKPKPEQEELLRPRPEHKNLLRKLNAGELEDL